MLYKYEKNFQKMYRDVGMAVPKTVALHDLHVFTSCYVSPLQSFVSPVLSF